MTFLINKSHILTLVKLTICAPVYCDLLDKSSSFYINLPPWMHVFLRVSTAAVAKIIILATIHSFVGIVYSVVTIKTRLLRWFSSSNTYVTLQSYNITYNLLIKSRWALQYLLNRPYFSNCSNGVCIMLFTLNFNIVFCYKTASDKIPHFCILSEWLME